MLREAPLPLEWTCLEGKVSCVRQESHTTWTCSCPKCGGSAHADGAPSDRCTLFIEPKPTLYCRRCGLVAFPDQFGDSDWTRPSAEELERRRLERVEYEEARKRSAEMALANLSASRQWEIYNEQAGIEGRNYWRAAGISDSWQSFWLLGWTADHQFGGITCDAASIPIFGPGWQIRQIKYRLMDESKGRYRADPRGIGSLPFLCDPDGDYSGHVIVVEGEKKAAVTFTRLGDGKRAVIGMPGTSPGLATLDALGQADRITLVVDPGAKAAGIKLAKTLGIKRCRLLETQVKIDDFLVSNNTTKHELEWLLRGATILSAFVVAK